MGQVLIRDHLNTGNDILHHSGTMHVNKWTRSMQPRERVKKMTGHMLFSLFCVFSGSQGRIVWVWVRIWCLYSLGKLNGPPTPMGMLILWRAVRVFVP